MINKVVVMRLFGYKVISVLISTFIIKQNFIVTL